MTVKVVTLGQFHYMTELSVKNIGNISILIECVFRNVANYSILKNQTSKIRLI